MARDSAVGRERILVVPSSLALDNSTTNQHVTSAQNDLNQQILEVSQFYSTPTYGLLIILRPGKMNKFRLNVIR